MDCTITQLVIRDLAVVNERTSSVVEVGLGLPVRLACQSPRLAASIDSCLPGEHKQGTNHILISHAASVFSGGLKLVLQAKKKLFQNLYFHTVVLLLFFP